MTNGRRVAAILVTFLASGLCAAEIVVLKGGTVIELKSPPVRRGDTVLLTRNDGTLLSVPASEIDRPATAAARSAAAPAPPPAAYAPSTPAGAARASREVPKARIRITDADVSHAEAQAAGASPEGEAAEEEKDASAGAGRVEVADYTQEKSGEALIVRGTLRNPGATPAINVRMSVTAIDPKGQTITSGEAGISNGVIEPSRTVAFSVTISVGVRPVGSLKFAPRWVAPALPAPASGSEEPVARERAAAPAAPAASPRASAPPQPEPTPYGRGSLYAPPAPNAPSEPPKDGKTGYIPGASNPANQPKPPS